MRVFGCSAYTHVPKDKRKKLESKAKECIFLGYATSRKGYRLYNQTTSSIVHSRDVVFNESARGYKSVSDQTIRETEVENLTDQEKQHREKETYPKLNLSKKMIQVVTAEKTPPVTLPYEDPHGKSNNQTTTVFEFTLPLNQRRSHKQ